nr:cache domain-containing protein [Streptomyces bathyalis]
MECVFDAVTEIRADTLALLAGASAEDRQPTTTDLAGLRPGLKERLARLALMSGAGFVAAPGLLADAEVWLEWWQTGPGGEVRPLLLDLDPQHSAYSDYTHWEWYALARDTGQRAVAGPYVDYLCSDEYSLTLSMPVTLDGRFTGVAAADVYLPDFEAAVMPVLQRLPGPACLVNSRGRVAVSTYADHLAGSLLKGPDFTAVPAAPADGGGAAGESGGPGTGEPGPHVQEGLALRACGDIPLILVTGED